MQSGSFKNSPGSDELRESAILDENSPAMQVIEKSINR